MKWRTCTTCLGALVLVAACRRAENGVVLQQRTTTTGAAERTSESTQYWTDKLMVLDEPATRLIVDFAAEKMTSVDKDKKVFVTFTFDHMRSQVEAARAKLEAETAGLPPDAKATLEGMGEDVGDLNAPVEVNATGKRETIAGYDTEEYTFAGTAASGSLWISKELPLPLGEAETKAFEKSTLGMKGPGRQFAKAMLQAKGVPLRTVMNIALGPEGTSTRNEVVEVRREAIPAVITSVPPDFRQITPQAAP